MRRLRVGVVGCGHIVVHRHLPVLRKLKEVNVAAICDKDQLLAERVASRFGIGSVYSDVSRMLSQDLDVIDICTPPKTHFSMSLEALKKGCHVLIEKPLAMDAKEAQEMIDCAGRNNLKLCVVHQNLYNPAVQCAKRIVESGALGDVLSVQADTFIRRDHYMCLDEKHWCHTLPGGFFFEMLPHPVYLLQEFMRNIKLDFVLAHKFSSTPWMKGDELRVIAEGQDCIGELAASCNAPSNGDTLTIIGTQLILQVDLSGRRVLRFGYRAADPYSIGRANLSLAGQFLGVTVSTAKSLMAVAFGGIRASAHYGAIQASVRSMLNEGEMPVSTEAAKENVRIVQEICERIEQGLSS